MPMTSYFDEVVASLTSEDANLLGVLSEADATAKLKALNARTAQETAGLTEAKFRKITTRMNALKFTEVSTDYKEHALFLTPYGMAALATVIQTLTSEGGIRV
jgi:hypothetical protein